jgi:two-component system chemotaxis response regulator CheB
LRIVTVLAATAKPADDATRPVRVMIVDDALVVRGFLKRWIDAEPDLELVASIGNGQEAIDWLDSANPDVVVLDVEMPKLDGITALPLLLQKKPGLVVIMASTLTRRNAEISLRALALGALDCIPKPDANSRIGSDSFHGELINKIRELGLGARKPRLERRRALDARARQLTRGEPVRRLPAETAPPLVPATTPTLRPFPRMSPKVLVIGSSTGGPQALTEVVTHLQRVNDRAPVLITQHMPPTFTTILAEHLSRASGRVVREAVDGEPVVAGRIYLAPGGLHMRVKRQDKSVLIGLDDGAHVHFCRPAVDPLFSSAAAIWGAGTLGLILTGMGSDGTSGAADIVAAGGAVIAQDEPTSVVWGMPGSVAEAGLCSAILPVEEIAPKIVRLFLGERP